MKSICDDQKLLDAQDRLEAIEGIKRGLESMKRNAGKSAEEFFGEFFADKDIFEQEWPCLKSQDSWLDNVSTVTR